MSKCDAVAHDTEINTFFELLWHLAIGRPCKIVRSPIRIGVLSKIFRAFYPFALQITDICSDDFGGPKKGRFMVDVCLYGILWESAPLHLL